MIVDDVMGGRVFGSSDMVFDGCCEYIERYYGMLDFISILRVRIIIVGSSCIVVDFNCDWYFKYVRVVSVLRRMLNI